MLNQWILALSLLFCAGCDVQDTSPLRTTIVTDSCRTVAASIALPAEVRETSGLAFSSTSSGVLWTHNDRGGEPVVHAIDAQGRHMGATAVTGAASEDWEDIESGPCGDGTCLYIADIGDNSGARDFITIYEVPEPTPGTAATEAARALHGRYPDGPHNAESLFLLPGGDLYIVTKGDDGPITLYRYPAAARVQGNAVLEKVSDVMPEPQGRTGRATGASATPDGSRVVIRTYGHLYIHAADALVTGSAASPMVVDLSGLGEPQGEGVAMSDDGTVWLSSEAEDGGATPRLAQLSCSL